MDWRPRFGVRAIDIRPTVSVVADERAEQAAGAGASAAPAIRLAGVPKRFGEIRAVNGLDLEGRPGVCFGLLGPNGAGKSTTMRMLTAQTLADEGSISVLGYELPRESKQSRLEMGVVPQLDNLDVELTCRQGPGG